MENDSFGHEYYYDGDEGVEMECQRQQSDVSFSKKIVKHNIRVKFSPETEFFFFFLDTLEKGRKFLIIS